MSYILSLLSFGLLLLLPCWDASPPGSKFPRASTFSFAEASHSTSGPIHSHVAAPHTLLSISQCRSAKPPASSQSDLKCSPAVSINSQRQESGNPRLIISNTFSTRYCQLLSSFKFLIQHPPLGKCQSRYFWKLSRRCCFPIPSHLSGYIRHLLGNGI